MILNFQPGLKADKSATAKKFYLALTSDYVPERRLTKDEFLKSLEPDSDLKKLAEAVNFENISRAGDRILLNFPKNQKVQIAEDDLIGSKEVTKTAEDDDDLIGDSKPKSKPTKEQPAANSGVVLGKTEGWFESKGERVAGVIEKEIKSHDKWYYGIMKAGKIKYKLREQVNIGKLIK